MKKTMNSKVGREFGSLGLAILLVVMAAGTCSLAAASGQPKAQPRATDSPDAAPADSAASEEALHLLVGRSLVITSPTPIQRISVADPATLDAIAVSPSQILLNGKQAGSSSLVVWTVGGHVQTFDVGVDVDTLALERNIRKQFGNDPVQVRVDKNIVTLSGQVANAETHKKVVELADAMVAKKEDVVDMLTVPAAPDQGEVLLQVRFAEVDRSALSQLGINIISTGGANKTIGSTSTQQFAPPQIQQGQTLTPTNGAFQISDLLNVFIWRPDINLAAMIKALSQRNMLQILAEPNLLTEPGKEASFLAGGEFPYAVISSVGSGGFPAITVQFKEFGVRLKFTPTITENNLIHLKVAPEVSTLDFANAVTISGFVLPAISTRRVESEMELRDGQTFAIAGLMDNRVQKQLEKVPGIGDIPILGKLFQSRSLQKSDDELLVVVTPHIVHPSAIGTQPQGPSFPVPFLPRLKPAPLPESTPGK